MDYVLWLHPVPPPASASGVGSVRRAGDARKDGTGSPTGLLLVFRIASIFYLALLPVRFTPALNATTDAIPRCVQQAGRNDGFYRRLRWMEAQMIAMERSDAFKGL